MKLCFITHIVATNEASLPGTHQKGLFEVKGTTPLTFHKDRKQVLNTPTLSS